MKPFVIVIGGTNSGKSSIISSLTGCETHTFRGLVRDKANGKQIYVIASSPQEDNLRRFAGILGTVQRNPSIIGLVMAIQPTYPRKRLSLEQIIHNAQSTHRLSIFAFVLNPPYGRQGVIDISDVQTRLSALGITPTYLDARRFAYLNASDIKSNVGIP